MPLNHVHRESRVATLVKVIDEDSLEVRQSLKSAERDKSAYSVREVRTQRPSIHAILSLRRIRHIDDPLERQVHYADSNEHRDDEERLNDHEDREDCEGPEHTLSADVGQRRDLYVHHADVLRESRKNSSNRIGIKEEDLGSRHLGKHHVVNVLCALADDPDDDLCPDQGHQHEEYDGAAEDERVLLLLLFLERLTGPISQKVRNEELYQRAK